MKHIKSSKLFLGYFCAFFFLFFFHLSYLYAQDIGLKLADSFLKKIPATEIDLSMNVDMAMKVQEKFLEVISKEYGAPIGYKAGLTNPNVQKVFGVNHPIRGTLLQNMILKSGVEIEAKFGTRPMCEGDLLVKIGSEDINQAKTPQETIKYLDAVIPFIELPDLVYDPNIKMNGAAIAAINVGARYGVMGEPISLAPTQDWIDRLKNFTLQVFDGNGTLLTEGKGSALLGDPLAVVLWIKDSLVKEGKKLKKGEILSLGTIGKMMPAKPNTSIKAKYIDLDPKGPVEISVKFK